MGFGKQLGLVLNELCMSVAQLSRYSGIPASTLHSIINRDSDRISKDKRQRIEAGLGVVPGSILYDLLYEKEKVEPEKWNKVQEIVDECYDVLEEYHYNSLNGEEGEDPGEELYNRIWGLNVRLGEIAKNIAGVAGDVLSEQEAFELWLKKNEIALIHTGTIPPMDEEPEDGITFKIGKDYYFITDKGVDVLKEASIETVKSLIVTFNKFWRNGKRPSS